MIVPVAPLGETVAVSVIEVPETADVAEGVTVVVVEPLVLDELVLPLPPQPATKAVTAQSVRTRNSLDGMFFRRGDRMRMVWPLGNRNVGDIDDACARSAYKRLRKNH